jgi:uncharacterized damage-inducible protein DinB
MPEPEYPSGSAGERELLERWLDFERDAVLRKIEGASDRDARAAAVPSGVSLLGILKHLANTEQGWFHVVFANEAPFMIDDPSDPDADWRVGPDETAETLAALYRTMCARSREIVDSASLDDVATYPGKDMTLRWIVVHMIEETARHAGHADVIREILDGATGL